MRSEANFIGKTSEEKQLIAEMQFIRLRKLNYSAIAARIGNTTPNTVKQVALGINPSPRIMATILEAWRENRKRTSAYEFWRDAA